MESKTKICHASLYTGNCSPETRTHAGARGSQRQAVECRRPSSEWSTQPLCADDEFYEGHPSSKQVPLNNINTRKRKTRI